MTYPATGKRLHAATKKAEDDFNQIGLSPVLDEIFLGLCDIANTPFAQSCKDLLKSRDFKTLTSLDPDFRRYSSEYDAGQTTLLGIALDYQLRVFYKKREDVDIGVDKEGVAFQKWLAAEEACSLTNTRFRERWSGTACSTPDVEKVIHLARQKISRILGKFSLEAVRDRARFGPGSDLSTTGLKTSYYEKYRTSGSVTPWAREWICTMLSGAGTDIREAYVREAQAVTSNRLSFVPKTCKTHRAIAVEPRWNVFAQLGVGELIAERLRPFGVDIRDQGRNVNLASLAYKSSLATIDLSSASDTISTNLVIDLLSDADPGWLDAILALRAPYVRYKGKLIKVSKVSSMGNGYTFPLETVVFYALARAAADVASIPIRAQSFTTAYGDDIIVPKEAADLTIRTLQYCGFSVNAEKTYIEGDFYESCGSDFFRGTNIRPIFFTEEVRTVAQAYTACNQLAALASRLAGGAGFAFRKVWHLRQLLIRRIPKHLRYFGPPEAGDGVIHSTFDTFSPMTRSARFTPSGLYRGWEGFSLRAFVPSAVTYYAMDPHGLMSSKLHRSDGSGNSATMRMPGPHRLKTVYVPTYTDYLLI